MPPLGMSGTLVGAASLIMFFIGFMIGYYWCSRVALRRASALAATIARGQVVAIVDDLSEDRIEVVPLISFKKGVFLSAIQTYPLVVFVPPNITYRMSLFFGKPIIYVVAFKVFGSAIDLRKLSAFGLARLSIQIGEWECRDNVVNCLNDLVQRLAEYVGSEGAGAPITITPDIRIGLGFDIPRLIKMLMHNVGEIGSTILTQIQETSQMALELARQMQRYVGLQVAEKTAWFRLIIMILIVAAFVGLLFLMMPGLFHVPPPK